MAEVNVFDKDDANILIDDIKDAIKEASNFNDHTDTTLDELIDNIDSAVDNLKSYIDEIGKVIIPNDQPPMLFNDIYKKQ